MQHEENLALTLHSHTGKGTVPQPQPDIEDDFYCFDNETSTVTSILVDMEVFSYLSDPCREFRIFATDDTIKVIFF